LVSLIFPFLDREVFDESILTRTFRMEQDLHPNFEYITSSGGIASSTTGVYLLVHFFVLSCSLQGVTNKYSGIDEYKLKSNDMRVLLFEDHSAPGLPSHTRVMEFFLVTNFFFFFKIHTFSVHCDGDVPRGESQRSNRVYWQHSPSGASDVQRRHRVQQGVRKRSSGKYMSHAKYS
jgi:hypothetical protein